MSKLEKYLNHRYTAGVLSIESLRKELLIAPKQSIPGGGDNQFFSIREAAEIIERA